VSCCGKLDPDDHTLNLHPLLANNKNLTHLTIEGDRLNFFGLWQGLIDNSHLTSLRLSNFSGAALQTSMYYINAKSSIKELTIAHSDRRNPNLTNQWIAKLIPNATLNKLTLIDCTLDYSSALALHYFIQFNTNLQSLCIKQSKHVALSDQSKALLQNSRLKSGDLIIE
jgi:hypothetical protein